MTDCTRQPLLFTSLGKQKIVADFDGGRLTSDAGGLLLREVDGRVGLTEALAEALADPRDPAKITHDRRTLLAQRIFGMALGYEDLNDHLIPVPVCSCRLGRDRFGVQFVVGAARTEVRGS
jgi:hypothetical protein